MTSTTTSRVGAFPKEGIKSPCVTATTANITLSGEQTVNTVAVVTGDRVLVKDQTDPAENGIYVAAVGAWTRADDWNTGSDVVAGVIVVDAGNDAVWKAEFTGSYTPDTTEVTFNSVFSVGAVEDGSVTTAKLAANAVTFAKMQRMDAGKIIIGQGASVDVTQVALNGDGTLSAAGVLTLGNGVINTAKLANNAVTFAKMQRMDSGKLLIGKGASVDVTQVAMSGDATLSAAGALTIGNAKITAAKLATDSIETAKIPDNAVTEAKLSTAVQAKLGTGWKLLSTTTPTATNTFDISLDSATYDTFLIVCENLQHASVSNKQLGFRLGHTGGSIFFSGTSDYQCNILEMDTAAGQQNSSSSFLFLAVGSQVTSAGYYNAQFELNLGNVANSPTLIEGFANSFDGTSTFDYEYYFGSLKQTTTIDAIRFLVTDGSTAFAASGEIRIYGRVY